MTSAIATVSTTIIMYYNNVAAIKVLKSVIAICAFILLLLAILQSIKFV